MNNGFWVSVGAWFGWNVAAPLLLIVLLVLLSVLADVPMMVRQHLCKHPRYFETGSCDAVCSDCRKNLGFIGTIQNQRRSQKGTET